MAVYTKLENEDFQNILKSYDIGSFKDAKGITEGVENTNYQLETSKDKYILTIYEKRVKEEELPFFVNLMEGLAINNIPAPLPIKATNGEAILKYNGKLLTIVSFLQGASPKAIKNEYLPLIGKNLAKIHLVSEKMSELKRPNTLSTDFWKQMIEKIGNSGEEFKKGISEELKKNYQYLMANWPKDDSNLPKGIIHADLFPDNVFFLEGNNKPELSAILDFYMACNDYFVYDIAITLNSWCFEPDHSFNITKAKALINSYNTERKITDAELKIMPLMCMASSMRFLLTRLDSYLNRVPGADVKIKDPNEYLKKMQFHSNVNSYHEYGI